MSLGQIIVVLSTAPIDRGLSNTLGNLATNLGLSLKPYDQLGCTMVASTHAQRWQVSRELAPTEREAFRKLASSLSLDLAFLAPSFKPARLRILAMDMDSTLINIECIDEIADFAGKKAEVAAITEATMRGEIKDFSESLRRRVALLKGISETVLLSVYKERLLPNPGASELLSAANAAGLHTLLVSGGFTFFTQRMQSDLGFTETHANTLEIHDGKLTGLVLGDIVDAAGKASHVKNACKALGCKKNAAITIGDGANDLLMMDGSGLSIAYRAKPVVKEKADAAFDRVGLDATLALIAQ
jgi:phosphoserine phosphatase